MAMSEEPDVDKYKCAICLDIFEDPVIIPCGNDHVVCYACIKHVLQDKSPKCSLCRTDFVARRVTKHKNLKIDMQSASASCQGCGKQIELSKLRAHQAGCDHIDRSIKPFEPVKQTTQPIPSNLPNRSTFSCPYCDAKNFDVTDLLNHCNEQHKDDPRPVVCPVCASMPWGDKGQKSSNFQQHLNHRHKFEYDTYVDYNQDDDAMLQAALKASLANS